MSGDASRRAAPGTGTGIGTTVLEQAFDGDSLYALRSAVAAHAASAGLPRQRVHDVVTAAHELAANAVRHGAGHGKLRLWADREALHCQVSDDGPAGQDPGQPGAATWQREHAHGLWIIDQVADRVRLDRAASGTTVTVTFTISPPSEPAGDTPRDNAKRAASENLRQDPRSASAAGRPARASYVAGTALTKHFTYAILAYMKDTSSECGRPDVAAFELLTRALVGIALESVRSAGNEVTLPQFRLLLALNGTGRVPSSRLATRLGLAASAITRMVDREEQAGLVRRGTDPRSRCIVTVELTDAGRELVAAVLAHRHERLATVLDQMSPQVHASAVAAAREFAALSGDAVVLGESGPVPV